jgi:hypothetical protein
MLVIFLFSEFLNGLSIVGALLLEFVEIGFGGAGCGLLIKLFLLHQLLVLLEVLLVLLLQP